MATAEHKIKNIMTYLIPQILSSIIPFITLPIITRFLTPQDFGVMALATSFPGLIVTFLTCNVNTSAQRYYFQYRNNHAHLGSLINTTIAYMLFVYFVSLPIVFFIRHFLSNLIMGSPDYGFAIFISYISACFGTIVGLYLTLFRNMEEAKKYSFFIAMQMLINASLTLLLVAVFHFGYMGLIYAGFWAAFIPFFFLFRWFLEKFPFNFNVKMLFDNFKYGIPLIPNMFIGSIQQFFDKFILRSIISLSSVGIYSIAQNISGKLFVFITAVQSTFHPLFMKDMFDRGKEGASSIGRNFTIFTFISLSAVLGMILFGEELICLLAPPSYYNAINVMLIILCGTATSSFGKIVGMPLEYAKKVYLSFPIAVFGVISNIFLNLLFIPLWRAEGAGIAALITCFMTTVITGSISQRYYKILYEKQILLFLYSNVFVSAILLIYFRIAGAHFLLKYSVKLASLLIFIFIGIYAKIITKANVKIALNVFTFGKGNIMGNASDPLKMSEII